MYIGGVGTAGLHHLVWEILDNAVDEAMNGYASNVTLTLHEDGSSVTVSDDGRSIPVDKHPKTKKSALEVIFTVLHAGGKFEQGNYKTAGGLHGVGASVVNALSTELQARVKRDGAEWEMSFKRGHVQGSLKKVGAARAAPEGWPSGGAGRAARSPRPPPPGARSGSRESAAPEGGGRGGGRKSATRRGRETSTGRGGRKKKRR